MTKNSVFISALQLVVIALVMSSFGADLYTSCEEQIGNFMGANQTFPLFEFEPTIYVDHDGLSNTPLVPQTTIHFTFGSAITSMGASRNPNNTYESTDNPQINYMTIPWPWCTYDLILDCASIPMYGVDRPDYASCSLQGKDMGPTTTRSPYEAGRVTILPFNTPQCNGDFSVTYVGVYAEALEPSFQDMYTYGIEGILDPPQSPTISVGTGSCSVSDGLNVNDGSVPDEFVCGPASQKVLKCYAGGHPPGTSGPDIGIKVQCIDSLPSSTLLDGLPYGTSGEGNIIIRVEPGYRANMLAFVDIDYLGNIPAGYPQGYYNTIVTQIVAWQYVTPYFNLTRTLAYRLTNYVYETNAVGLLGNEDIESIPPCICNIMVLCTPNDEIRLDVPYNVDNIPPVARFDLPNLPTGFVRYEYNATRNFTLDGTASFDPDTLPFNQFYHYWELVEAPPGGDVMWLTGQDVEDPVVDFTGISGEYLIAHHVSDGQDRDVITQSLFVTGYAPYISNVYILPFPPNNYINTTTFILITATDPDNYPGLGLNITFGESLVPGPTNVTDILTFPGGFSIIFSTQIPGLYVYTYNVTDGIYYTAGTINVDFKIPPPPPPVLPTPPPVPVNACNGTFPGSVCLTNSILCTGYGGIINNSPGLCDVTGGMCCVKTPVPSPSPGPSPPPSSGPPNSGPPPTTTLPPNPNTPSNSTTPLPFSEPFYIRYGNFGALQWFIFILILGMVVVATIGIVLIMRTKPDNFVIIVRQYIPTYSGPRAKVE